MSKKWWTRIAGVYILIGALGMPNLLSNYFQGTSVASMDALAIAIGVILLAIVDNRGTKT